MKFAVTIESALVVITHVPVPVHALPDQPLNAELPLGVAVNVTDVP
jgi:hypothetical protein